MQEIEERTKTNKRIQRYAGILQTKRPLQASSPPAPISSHRPTMSQVRAKLEKLDRDLAGRTVANHDKVEELIKQAEAEVGIDKGS